MNDDLNSDRRLRVLLVAPYTPLEEHDHAAADYMSPLVAELGKLVELHVYAPSSIGSTQTLSSGGVVYHGTAKVRRPKLALLGLYPYHWRERWSRRSTSDVRKLVELIQPDVVHIEYPQPSEVALSIRRVPMTMTLHDLVTVAYRGSLRSRPWTLRGGVERLELCRYGWWERAAIRHLSHAFVRSRPDGDSISGLVESWSAPKIGIDLDVPRWKASGEKPQLLLFAGAMWRKANSLTACFIADEVLPRVRAEHPNARLRIIGARPSDEVLALAARDGIEVVGRVDDYEQEFAMASVVLAPSIVEVGVLLKALHSLAAGAPTLLNDYSARGLEGLVPDEDALVADTPEEMARAIGRVLSDPALAAALGAAGRRYVEAHHSWPTYAREYLRGFERALGRLASPRV